MPAAKQGKSTSKLNRDIADLSYPSPTHEYQSIGDIESIREAKAAIERQAQESHEEMRRIKEECKRYKEEIRQQERARKDLEQQQELKQKMTEHQSQMQTQLRQAKEHLFDYKFQKFEVIMKTLMARRARLYKGVSFQTLQSYTQHLKFQEMRLVKLQRFQVKGRVLHMWVGRWRQESMRREAEEREREELIMAARMRTAECHRDRGLKRKAIRAIKKESRAARDERAIEREHEKRKHAIDGFFSEL